MSKTKNYRATQKFSSITSSISSFISFLGGYQVCHNLCLGIITLLSIVGITVVGMPLLFLQKVTIPFWIVAVMLLVVALTFYFKKKCISRNLILFNTGIIIAGVPFEQFQDFIIIFWIIGGSLITISLILYIKNKIKY